MKNINTLLKDEQRQPCEVWTRVMGYHRPVSQFNIGKKGEYQERKFFKESSAIAAMPKKQTAAA